MAKSELERKLEEIDALRKEGVLTDSEYEVARQRAIQTSEIGQPTAPEPAGPANSSRSSRFGCGKTLLVIIGVLDPIGGTTTYTFSGGAINTRQTVATSNGLAHYMIYDNGMLYFRLAQSGQINFIDRVAVSW